MPNHEDDGDVVVVEDRQIPVPPSEKERLFHARLAVFLATLVVAVIAVCGMVVLVSSFFLERDAPSWAQAVETAAMTAALALIFKDRAESRS
jgi:uncharacterized membrane protein YqjE